MMCFIWSRSVMCVCVCVCAQILPVNVWTLPCWPVMAAAGRRGRAWRSWAWRIRALQPRPAEPSTPPHTARGHNDKIFLLCWSGHVQHFSLDDSVKEEIENVLSKTKLRSLISAEIQEFCSLYSSPIHFITSHNALQLASTWCSLGDKAL